MADVDLSLLERYLSRECSPEERVQVESWMKDNTISEKQLKELLFPPYDVSVMARLSPEKDWERVRQRIYARAPKSRVLVWSRMAAAVLLLIMAGLYVYFADPFHVRDPLLYTITCRQEPFKEVVLPDGSIVHIRKGSQITYAETFAATRQLSMRGEVMFNVVPNPSKAFTVSIGQAKVVVMGTSFHILDTKDQLDVNVTSGKVSFQVTAQREAILTKGDHGYFLKTSLQLFKERNRDPNFLSWKTREQKFSDASLETVARDIGDYFNVSVRVEGNSKLTYTSSFKNPTLKEILDEMTSVLGLNYELEGQSVVIILKDRR